tara:strand:- start:16466 stop:17755 length:1290 start_codon:yes stop_codon:yes gene_type:complete
MDEKKYLIKSTLSGLSNHLISILITLFSIPFIVSNIGMEAYGLWVLSLIFVELAAFALFGMDKALVLSLSNKRFEDKHKEILGSVMLLQFGIILLASIFTIFIIQFNIAFFGKALDASSNLFSTLIISGLIIFIAQLLSSTFKAILEANLRIDLVNFSNLLLTFALYSSVLIASFYNLNISNILQITALIYSLICLINLILVYKTTRIRVCFPKWLDIKKFLNLSKEFFALNVLNSSILPVNKYLFLILIGDLKFQGILDIIFRITYAAQALLSAFSAPLFSYFSRLGTENLLRVDNMVSKFIAILITLYCSGIAIYLTVADYIAALFVEETLRETFSASLLITLIMVLIFSIVEPIVKKVTAFGKVNYILLAKSLHLPTNFILLYLFADNLTIIEFAFCFGAGYVMVSIAFVLIYFIKDKIFEKNKNQ